MNFPARGEAWLISLSPIVGSEIGKTRPALVISNDRNNEFADTITVIPISSRVERTYPFEVFISKAEAGLPKDSKVKCNQIRTVDRKRLVKFLGRVSLGKLKEVEEALLIHLGIDYGKK